MADPPQSGLVGLVNLGNTCFLNAVLQALAHTPELRRLVLEARATSPPPSASSLPSLHGLWADVLDATWTAQPHHLARSVSPHQLVQTVKRKIPRFGSSAQQDAHEFLRMFCDELERELHWATEAFGGKMSSEITCLACHRVKQRHDPYLDLSLDLPGHKIITVRNRQPRPLRLHDCFRDFSRAEQLHASTEAMCADCTPPPRQTKQLRIFTLPRVLVVHLKRFNWALALGQKIRRYVQFPLRGLCLDPYLAENAPPESSGVVYDLTCVVVHHGLRIDFGHYTSYCLNRSEKRWYHFDDERVTPIDDEVVARSEAYILFYSKRE